MELGGQWQTEIIIYYPMHLGANVLASYVAIATVTYVVTYVATARYTYVIARLPDVSSTKNKIHMDRRLAYKERARDVRSRLSSSSQRSMDLNSETGSSAWLTVLPLQDQGFHLNKQEF